MFWMACPCFNMNMVDTGRELILQGSLLVNISSVRGRIFSIHLLFSVPLRLRSYKQTFFFWLKLWSILSHKSDVLCKWHGVVQSFKEIITQLYWEVFWGCQYLATPVLLFLIHFAVEVFKIKFCCISDTSKSANLYLSH